MDQRKICLAAVLCAVVLSQEAQNPCRQQCGGSFIVKKSMFQQDGTKESCCEHVRCKQGGYNTTTSDVNRHDNFVSIPKILHSIAIYPEGKQMSKLIRQITEIHSAMVIGTGWEIMHWDLNKSTALIAEQYSFYLPIWNAVGNWKGNSFIARSDMFRNFALHSFGGLYMDSDMLLCHTTLDRMVADEWNHNVATFYSPIPSAGQVNNAIYSASPHHPVFEVCIDEMQRKLLTIDYFSMIAVGPFMLATCIERYSSACSANIPNFREKQTANFQGMDDLVTDDTKASFVTYGDVRFPIGGMVGNSPKLLVWHLGAGTWIPKTNPNAPKERSLCTGHDDAQGCVSFEAYCPVSWNYTQHTYHRHR